MMFVNHLCNFLEHIFSTRYGIFYASAPMAAAIVYLILYVLDPGRGDYK